MPIDAAPGSLAGADGGSVVPEPPATTVEVVTTAYGRPALAQLALTVEQAKAGDPLAPVTVVVPSNHVGVTARRALARGTAGRRSRPGRGTIAVDFLTVYRLAELLGAPQLAAQGRRPVSTPVVAAALRQALRDDPGVFAPVAEHPATEEALVTSFAELADLSPQALVRLASTGGRAADVVDLCRRARQRLAAGWYDEADLLTAARQSLAAEAPGPSARVAALGHVVVYLPQDLSRGAAALLRLTAGACPATVLVGLTGHSRADAGVQRSLTRLGAALPTGRPVDPPTAATGTWPVSVDTTRIVSTSDADDEIRAAVRTIVDAARVGTPLERIAVLFATEEPYARLLHEHLGAAGVPVNGTAAEGLKGRVLGRACLDLLALRDHNYRRRDVLGLLGSAPLRPFPSSNQPDTAPGDSSSNLPPADATGDASRGQEQAVNPNLPPQVATDDASRGQERAVSPNLPPKSASDDAAWGQVQQSGGGWSGPTADWERLSREAAVVSGRAQWDQRLAQLADELEHRASEVEDVDDDRREARSARLQRRAGRARRLRRLVVDLIDELEQAAAESQPWRDRVDWLRRLLRRLFGDESARERWPEAERKAADRVEAALDRLIALDAVDGAADLDVFRRTLELELDADLGRVGRFGEGVLVAPLSFAVGIELDLLVVVGMAEGTLPARPADDSLLPDRERQATRGELPLRRELLDRQQRQLHAGLAAASRQVLCVPRGDLRASNERVPSRWLAEMLAPNLPPRVAAHDAPQGQEHAVHPNLPPKGAAHDARRGQVETVGNPTSRLVLDEVPSFAYGVTHVPFPATAQEYRLRAFSATAGQNGAAGPPLVDPIVAAGRELQRARRSSRFTRFDGNLAGQPVRSPLDDVVSATRLESWATCPQAYFVRQVLHVLPTEDPADLLWISALDRGSLVHQVLERFLQAVLARPLEEQPGPDDAWSEADHELLHGIGSEVCADYEARGVVGRAVFWQRDRARILGRLDRFLHEDSVRRRLTRSRPVAAELGFGLPGTELGPVDVAIAGGRTLHFRGAADRIDVGDDGTLRVIDYKTGRPYDYRALSEENPDDRGTHLQLAVYGVAARAHRQMPDAPVVAEYWFVTEQGQLTQTGYTVTDDVLDRVGQTLGIVVDGIERGAFPARPTARSTDPWVRCPYCDPDGLGVTDRRREWERKRHDPAVAPYAHLAEPEATP